MTVTVIDLLKKYPTEFNLDEIPDTFKNVKVGENLDQIQKPTHKKINNHNKYIYKIKDKEEEGLGFDTIIIDNYLGHYTVDFPYDYEGEMGGGFFVDENGFDQSYS